MFLYWARFIQYMLSHPVSLRSVLILFLSLHPGPPGGLMLSDFPTKAGMHVPSPHICHMLCPSYSPDMITWTVSDEYKLWSSSLYHFLQLLLVPSPLGWNIFLRTLCWNTVSLCSSINVRHQVLHPYKTAGKSMVVYFNLHILRMRTRRHKIVAWTVADISWM